MLIKEGGTDLGVSVPLEGSSKLLNLLPDRRRTFGGVLLPIKLKGVIDLGKWLPPGGVTSAVSAAWDDAGDGRLTVGEPSDCPTRNCAKARDN